MSRKVVTYIRVSTEEQAKHGYSIPAQRQILEDYAKGHELTIVQEFVESESAYKPGRPEFAKMLALLKKRREITGVLCYKIDRIARNLRDYSELSEMVGVSIISATEALPENATGTLIGTVQAAFSRYFSDQLGERVKLGMETKARRGVWPTSAPIGYLNDPTTRGIVPDPHRASLVEEMFEIYVHKGLPLSQLVLWASERGLTNKKGGRLSKSTIHRTLMNPAYYGVVRWHGIIYPGIHKPLISRALFDRAQERLSAGSFPLTKREFPYRGLLQCGYCGCTITAGLAKGRYIYYFCTQGRGKCPQPYVRQDRLGENLQALVANVHLSKSQVAMLMNMFDRERQQREERKMKKLETLNGRLEVIGTRRNAAYMDKLDGRISEERWIDLERVWSREMDDIRRQTELLDVSDEPPRDDVRTTLELLERGPALYSGQSDEEKGRLLRTLLLNCRVTGEKLDPVYKRPFDLVAIGVETDNWYARRDSNPQPPVPKTGALSS
jgi:site-specific DNA recombinase